MCRTKHSHGINSSIIQNRNRVLTHHSRRFRSPNVRLWGGTVGIVVFSPQMAPMGRAKPHPAGWTARQLWLREGVVCCGERPAFSGEATPIAMAGRKREGCWTGSSGSPAAESSCWMGSSGPPAKTVPKPAGTGAPGTHRAEPAGTWASDSDRKEPAGARASGKDRTGPAGTRASGRDRTEPAGTRASGSDRTGPAGTRASGRDRTEPAGAGTSGSDGSGCAGFFMSRGPVLTEC
uniref:Uncharacterized protein n=1 Tax=Neolamprologus brichardi TaxID=32507 RepID=A0A3Q4H1I2_NEOBR